MQSTFRPHMPEFKGLAIALVASLLAVVFAMLAGEVTEGETGALDRHAARLAAALRSTHPWLSEVMRDLSGLGSTVSLTLMVTMTSGFLLLVGRKRVAIAVASASATGAVAVHLLKGLFARPRPGPEFSDLAAMGMSFPSGHASMSTIVFLTTAALLCSTRQRGVERAYILGAGMSLAVLVGLSRIALGVHWLTDVLGGWMVGTAWAMAWLLAARSPRLQTPASPSDP